MMSGKLPREVIDQVREQLVSNPARNNKEIRRTIDLTPQIKKIEAKVDQCYEFVNRANKFFWLALLVPEPHLGERPEYYSQGTEAEMQLYLKYSYAGRKETPGAIEAIRKQMAGDI